MNFICFRFSYIWVRMFCYNSNSQVLNRKKWSYAALISKLCSLGSSTKSKEEVDPIRKLSRGILISRSVQFSYFDCQVNKFIYWLIAGVMFLEGDWRKQNHNCPNKPGPPTPSILTGLDIQNWTATPPSWKSSCTWVLFFIIKQKC